MLSVSQKHHNALTSMGKQNKILRRIIPSIGHTKKWPPTWNFFLHTAWGPLAAPYHWFNPANNVDHNFFYYYLLSTINYPLFSIQNFCIPFPSSIIDFFYYFSFLHYLTSIIHFAWCFLNFPLSIFHLMLHFLFPIIYYPLYIINI